MIPNATLSRFFMGEIFFLYTYIITKNPTRGRVNVTLIDVVHIVVDLDDSSLVEYKVFFLNHIYEEVLVNDRQLLYLVFYILVLTLL